MVADMVAHMILKVLLAQSLYCKIICPSHYSLHYPHQPNGEYTNTHYTYLPAAGLKDMLDWEGVPVCVWLTVVVWGGGATAVKGNSRTLLYTKHYTLLAAAAKIHGQAESDIDKMVHMHIKHTSNAHTATSRHTHWHRLLHHIHGVAPLWGGQPKRPLNISVCVALKRVGETAAVKNRATHLILCGSSRGQLLSTYTHWVTVQLRPLHSSYYIPVPHHWYAVDQ